MLEKERKKIDQLDREIIQLLEERFDVVQQIAEIKKANNIEVLDASRETEVLEKISTYISKKIYQETLLDIYQGMMDCSKEYQKKQLGK